MKISTQQIFEQLQHLVMKKGKKKKKKKKNQTNCKAPDLVCWPLLLLSQLTGHPIWLIFIMIILIKLGTPEGLLILPFCPKCADGTANSVDTDVTARRGAV